MPRPVKCRKVCHFPNVLEFLPADDTEKKMPIVLTVDEYETIRLLDKKGYSQEQCAESMQIARTTVQRIYEIARKKIADALIDGHPLKIEGGDFIICDGQSSDCSFGGCYKHEIYQKYAVKKGEGIMRIAVTYENGQIFQHFGHTETFKIYDVEEGKVLHSEVVDTNGSGHGALAGVLNALNADVLICGGIGGDAKTSPWYKLSPDKRPEAGLLKIRKSLGLFANLRPAYLYQELKDACPLKEEIIGEGFDMLIMRELTGGLYFGERSTVEENGIKKATDTLTYSEPEIRRIAIRAFDIARKRKKKVTSVDKANVLDSSRLWRAVVEDVAKDYPDVTLEHMLVDNCAMQIVHNPCQFDVVLTENMFGDILSDEASMVAGSIGMLSSASLNETKFGLYEPSHGSAPDIAGKNIANPIATVLSAAMMLRYSLDLDKEAEAVENAVQKILKDGYRTVDIMSEGCKKVSTSEMGDLLVKALE